jgi:hypothetical protein
MSIRVQAAERILDRGVRFRLPASFLSRLLRRDRIDIRPLRAGTILEISRVVVGEGISEAIAMENWSFLEKSIRPVAKCIAIAILNDEILINKKLEALTRKLIWRVPAGTLVEMFQVVEAQNRLSDFMNTTKFLLTEAMMMMNPKNLGQEKNGR